MFETILFPTDGSEGASDAFEHVLDLAAAHDASIHVVNVVDTTGGYIDQFAEDVATEIERGGEEFVRTLAERADRRDVAAETAVVRGTPFEAIVEYADDRDVDLVAMATRGHRGLARFLLGSTTERVLRRSETPVLAIPPGSDEVAYPYENVLFPTDGSDCAEAALEVGVDVTITAGGRLHVVSVVDVASLGLDVRSYATVEPVRDRAKKAVEAGVEAARDAGLDATSGEVRTGTTIHGTLRTYVEENDVDLVVVGTHGRTGIGRYVLGSVTETLVRTSDVPVLTVRGIGPTS